MTTLRRILTAATLVVAASGLLSANPVITFGFDPTTGKDTVTQTVTIASTPFNVTSPQGLATFAGFASLGLGSAVYAAGDSTIDYSFTDTVANFQVTNKDTQADTVNFGLQSQVTLDGSTTLTNPDLRNTCNTIANAAQTNFLSGVCADNFALVSVTNQTIGAGATYTFPGLPVATTLSDNFGLGCGTFGDINHGDGCAVDLSNDSQYSGSSNVAFGVQNSGTYTFSAVGNANTNLGFLSTVNFNGVAEITYEYSIPSGTPEPTTMILMGGALLGLGVLRKKTARS